MKLRSLLVAIAAVSAVGAVSGEAAAQEYRFGAFGDLGSGLEGGGTGYASGVRRTRTTIRIGGEAWSTEDLDNRLSGSLLLELEPHTAVGADLRYLRRVNDHFFLSLGAIAVFIPSTMIGAGGGFELRQPLGKKMSLAFGPSLNAFFLGSDLPTDRVLWQGIFHGGVHFDL